jgi:LysR family transcriptional regulator of gallate degradation
MRVVLQTGQSDALNEQVEQAKLDLAVVPAYPARPFSCEQEVIGHDMMVAAVRSSHPLVRKRLASLSDLVPFSWALGAAHTTARQSVFDVFARAGLPAPHVALEVAFVTEASLAMVAATDLVALVPSRALESTAGRGLVELPIDGLQVERHLVLLSRRHAHWSPLMMSFREELISRVGQK